MGTIIHADIRNQRSNTIRAKHRRGRRNRVLCFVVLLVGVFACYSSEDAEDSPDGASIIEAGIISGDAGIGQNDSEQKQLSDAGLSPTDDASALADSGQRDTFDARVLTADEAGAIVDANKIPMSDGEPSDTEDGGVSVVEECGKLICPPGRTCCNPSCGICTGPGEICTKKKCDEPIGPYVGSSCDPSECGHRPVEVLMCEDGSSVRSGCVHREDGSCGYVESCPQASDAPCGGCQDDEYCAVSNCGSEAAQGVCTPRPESCTLQYDPVCGCDYWTYDNSCSARLAGTDVYYQGECYF